MKPTQITELLANIRKTFVSFFSILMFVALGVGVFLGILWSGPALETAVSELFDKGNMHHMQVQFPYGLTDEDLAALSEVEGVSYVEPAFQSFQTVDGDENDFVYKVQSISEDIDVLDVKEGKLPVKPDEMALKASVAENLGIGVGDTITFMHDPDAADMASLDADFDMDSALGGGAQAGQSAASSQGDATADDGMAFLNGDTFKITALVESPEYVALDSLTFGVSSKSSGRVDAIAWIPREAFDKSAFQDGYPIANVIIDELRGESSFSSEGKQKYAEAEERINELGTQLGHARYDSLHGRYQEKIDAAEKKVAEAQEKIEQGQQAIAEGEQKLEEGRATYERLRSEGEAKLAKGYEELMGYEALKAEGERKLAEARAILAEANQAIEYADAVKTEVANMIAEAEGVENRAKSQRDQVLAQASADLAAGKITQAEYDAAVTAANASYNAALDGFAAKVNAVAEPLAALMDIPYTPITHENWDQNLAQAKQSLANVESAVITYRGQSMTLAEARVKVTELRTTVQQAEAEYNSKVAQLNSGWETYHAGQRELEQKTAEYEKMVAEGTAKLDEVKQQVTEGQKLLAENKPKLRKAEERLAEMKDYSWVVTPRQYNGGSVEASTFSGVTLRLSWTMAALFIIVGLLVTYSAVSRIVHEQVTQIGTKKALGLRGREITTSFLLYSTLAVVAGAIIGTVVGIVLVQGIIGGVLGKRFLMGSYPPHFDPLMALGMTLLELVLVLGATWFACRSILKQHAVELLRGEKPPEAKARFYEKWAVWERLPLLTQTIVNNCVNDKRRVFSTIVGVLGCTALIVTAITLNNDVLKSYDRHYANVYHFNYIAYVEPGVDSDGLDQVEDILEDRGAKTTQILRTSMLVTAGAGDRNAIKVIVPSNPDEFAELYSANVLQGDAFDPSSEGVWISEAYVEHNDAKVGDSIAVTGPDGAIHDMPIRGVMEFYLTYNEVLMGSAYYAQEFGTAAVPNAVFANAADIDIAEVTQQLRTIEGFDSIVDDKTGQRKNFDDFSSVSAAVVLIYLALSVLMAIVVLLNLNVMFISEKRRELIVLMINGFTTKDAKRYIYNDTIVLTAIGIVLGLIVGSIMGDVSVQAIEPVTAHFVADPDLAAIGIGIVGSAVLAFVMSVIALRSIPRFNLTDINRF